MEIKLAQEFSILYQDPIFLVFLDLRESYENLDCGRLIQKLARYRAGPKLQGLLAKFWSRQEVRKIQNGFQDPKI